MDYKGKTFKSEWKDNILFLEIYQFNQEMFSLLEIVFDAAEKQGPYRILWDFRQTVHPGFMAMPKIIYKATKLYSTIKNAERASVLVVEKYYKYTKTVIRAINSKDTSYVGCNPIEATQFVS
jgi:hypothetical protein